MRATPDRAQRIGSFTVSTDGDSVSAFQTAVSTGVPTADAQAIPLTYPISWLARPDIRAAVMAAVMPDADGARILPVHVEQQVTMEAPMRRDRNYRLDLAAEGPDIRGMVRVYADVMGSQGQAIGSLVTVFVLVDADQGSAA